VAIPARLRWRCRRGTKELDLILTRFLEQEYASLSDAQKDDFEALLLEQDPDLAGWLWGGEKAPDRWRELIAHIQSASGVRVV